MSPRNLKTRLAREAKGRRNRYLADLAERAARTFAQGFVGVVTLNALTSVDLSLGHTLAAGALAGGYSILTSLAATRTGAADSASLLAADVDPPQ